VNEIIEKVDRTVQLIWKFKSLIPVSFKPITLSFLVSQRINGIIIFPIGIKQNERTDK
jgi:hypothetical protein